MRHQPRPKRRHLRWTKPDREAELWARLTEASAAVEAGARRIEDYEGLVRAANARQRVLAADLADVYAQLIAIELDPSA